MAYRFRRSERLSRAIRRVGGEQMQAAVDDLTEPRAADPEAVHDARKRVKKVRALARLVRSDLGEQFDADNALLRDAARRLSEARDAQVLVETFDDLMQHDEAPDAPADGAATVRQTLVRKVEAARRRLEHDDATTQARRAFDTGRQHIHDWPVKGSDWSTIRKGLKRAYKRGRNRMHAAMDDPTDENLHDWRKRAKDLWYDMRLLEGVWKPVMRSWVRELDRLGDLLGLDHDLAVFNQTLRDASLTDNGSAAQARLIDLARERRRELQADAFDLGRRIYTENPAAFADRIGGYWHAWRS